MSAPAGADARASILQAQVAGPGETSLEEVATRVVSAVAEAEPPARRGEFTDAFHALICEGSFLPSVPMLANAGRSGRLAACFVLDLEDSLESIYGNLHRSARIQQGSGGVGIDFSGLRPRGMPIERSGGTTPGPVAFAELFARSGSVMSMAGRRAGAHLAFLRDDHPDIVEFVRARRDHPASFPQLGFAIGLSDALLRSAREGGTWSLHHPLCATRRMPAVELLGEIAEAILDSGNPTLLFVDRIEADNPTPSLGALRATNPCGEQPLLPGESCVLGSVELPGLLTRAGAIDEERLEREVRLAVRFLDDALEVAAWPDAEIEQRSLATRKVGLGVMGLADLLLLAGLPYGGGEARALAGRVFSSIARAADAATCALAEERGAFPAWERGPRRRNATTRAFAPTGTLALLAGCSPGIEPFLAPRLEVCTASGERVWTDRWLLEWLERRSVDPEPVLRAFGGGAGRETLDALPTDDRALLESAWEISAEDQLAMQAETQRSVDGAVSKTVQLDGASPPSQDEILRLIERAHSLECKGVAFYCREPSNDPARIDLRAACDRPAPR